MASKAELLRLKNQRLGYHQQWLNMMLTKAMAENRSDLTKKFQELLFVVTSDRKV
jgi:hypothetical protein